MTISNSGLKAVSIEASLRCTVRVLVVMIVVFWKMELRPIC